MRIETLVHMLTLHHERMPSALQHVDDVIWMLWNRQFRSSTLYVIGDKQWVTQIK